MKKFRLAEDDIVRLSTGKKIVFKGTPDPIRRSSPTERMEGLLRKLELRPSPVPPRMPSPTPTMLSSTFLPPPIHRQQPIIFPGTIPLGTPMESSREFALPVLDTENGMKPLFWAARRTHDNYEDMDFLDCVLVGKNEIFVIDEEKLNKYDIELGGFFRASILDGEVCEFEKDEPPAGWIVKPYKKNLAAVSH